MHLKRREGPGNEVVRQQNVGALSRVAWVADRLNPRYRVLSRSRVTSRAACNADKRRVQSRDHVILVCLMLSQISYAPT